MSPKDYFHFKSSLANAKGKVVGDKYIRSGKIFEAGNYEDKKIEVTEADLDAMVSKFSPAQVSVEHAPSIFDGRLGEVEKVWKEGSSLFGDVAFPLWARDAIGDIDVPVSCEIKRSDKTLAGLTLTVEPRVHDAVLFSAAFSNGLAIADFQDSLQTDEGKTGVASFAALFAKKKTDSGQSVLRRVHDDTARAGAICNLKEGKASMHASHEMKRIQDIHDLASPNGEHCTEQGKGSSWYGMFSKLITSATTDREDEADMSILKPTTDEEKVSFFEKYIAPLLGGGKADKGGEGAGQAAQFSNDPKVVAELARLKKEREDRIETDALAFAKEIIMSKRAAPAMKDGLIAQFTRCAKDDLEHGGTVKFSARNAKGKVEEVEGTRVDQLRAMFAVAPKSTLTEETMREDVDAEVLFDHKGIESDNAEFNGDYDKVEADAAADAKAYIAKKNAGANGAAATK